jgi:methionyl-tRNA formyltransferase
MLAAGTDDQIIVATGDNGLAEIVDLQPAGKRCMSAVEFLRGHPFKLGYRFGPESPER